MSPWRLRQIAFQINHDALIAYPSDTIWGFGCHPLSFRAAQRIQSLKQRSERKGLILLSSSLDLCHPFIDESMLYRHVETLSRPADKPLTWIITASTDCPEWLTRISHQQSTTIAIRITNHPLIKQLCETLQAPLVSTSANVSGRATARNSFLVHKYFHSQVDFIIEGFNDVSKQASEIRDIQSDKILRS